MFFTFIHHKMEQQIHWYVLKTHVQSTSYQYFPHNWTGYCTVGGLPWLVFAKAFFYSHITTKRSRFDLPEKGLYEGNTAMNWTNDCTKYYLKLKVMSALLGRHTNANNSQYSLCKSKKLLQGEQFLVSDFVLKTWACYSTSIQQNKSTYPRLNVFQRNRLAVLSQNISRLLVFSEEKVAHRHKSWASGSRKCHPSFKVCSPVKAAAAAAASQLVIYCTWAAKLHNIPPQPQSRLVSYNWQRH